MQNFSIVPELFAKGKNPSFEIFFQFNYFQKKKKKNAVEQ